MPGCHSVVGTARGTAAPTLPPHGRGLSPRAVTNWFGTGLGLAWDWFLELLGGSRGWGDVLPQWCFLHLPRALGVAADPAGVSSLRESLWLRVVSREGKWHKGCAVTSRAARGVTAAVSEHGSSWLRASPSRCSRCSRSDQPPCPACLCSVILPEFVDALQRGAGSC